jgi:hypothetical protein
VCDTAFQDAATRKTSLIGIFDNINSLAFPAVHSALQLFIKLADGEGIYDIEVRFVQAATSKIVGRTSGTITMASRLSSMGFVIPFQNLPIPVEGTYEFQVWMNQAFIGSATVNAVKIEAQGA